MEVFYFCRDGRILPALGQQSFVMIDLEQPNKMRLFNMDESIRDALKSAVVKTQPHLEQISECEEFTEFKWNRPVWNHTLGGFQLLDLILSGGNFICQKESFTRFALQSECCYFNQ